MKNYVTQLAKDNNLELDDNEIIEIVENIITVKISYRIHNLSIQRDEKNTNKVKRKVEETKKYFLKIAKEFNLEAYKKIKALLLYLEIKLAGYNNKVGNIVENM